MVKVSCHMTSLFPSRIKRNWGCGQAKGNALSSHPETVPIATSATLQLGSGWAVPKMLAIVLTHCKGNAPRFCFLRQGFLLKRLVGFVRKVKSDGAR